MKELLLRPVDLERLTSAELTYAAAFVEHRAGFLRSIGRPAAAWILETVCLSLRTELAERAVDRASKGGKAA